METCRYFRVYTEGRNWFETDFPNWMKQPAPRFPPQSEFGRARRELMRFKTKESFEGLAQLHTKTVAEMSTEGSIPLKHPPALSIFRGDRRRAAVFDPQLRGKAIGISVDSVFLEVGVDVRKVAGEKVESVRVVDGIDRLRDCRLLSLSLWTLSKGNRTNTW